MDDDELHQLIELCTPLFEAILRGEHGARLQREAQEALAAGRNTYVALGGLLHGLAPRIEAGRKALEARQGASEGGGDPEGVPRRGLF